jgi:hypothetical protein
MTYMLRYIDQLITLVNIDKKDHLLKRIALLLISAMNDWPRLDQKVILEFIQELKGYYGIPLTKEKILNKIADISDNDFWRHEAGSSIIELFDLYKKLNDHSDFDKIIQDVMSYYGEQLKIVDFIAELKYLTGEEGGRNEPAFSGYRPHVKFDFAEMQTSGQQTFLNKEVVYPGDTVEAAVKIASVDFFENCLEEGMVFQFREGPTTIGTGKITDIINEKLKKNIN